MDVLQEEKDIMKPSEKLVMDIINIFEVGDPTAKYDTVSFLAGDNGHISYGISQCSLMSGNLYLLIRDYISAGGAHAEVFKNDYLRLLAEKDDVLDVSPAFRSLLVLASKDHIMRQVQDAYEAKMFLEPAKKLLEARGFSKPLTLLVFADSVVHGGMKYVLKRMLPGPIPTNERAFVGLYLRKREEWLRAKGGLLSNTVYRCGVMKELAKENRWDLQPPFDVRGWTWTGGAWLGKRKEVPRIPALSDHNILYLLTPNMHGKAVQDLQVLLGVEPDGIFGKLTKDAVVSFQKKHNLTPDGIAGPITWRALREEEDKNGEVSESAVRDDGDGG